MMRRMRRGSTYCPTCGYQGIYGCNCSTKKEEDKVGDKIENLIFEGGGVKSIGYGGALKTMYKLGKLKDIKRVGGTSAGAITACLMALGYTSGEIADIIVATKFSSFKDDSFGLIRDSIRLIKYYGWHKGDTFKEWLGDFVYERLGKRDATFGELKNKTKTSSLNHKLFKDLYVVVTNLTKQRPETYSYETTPDMPIVDAVRISMSIPIFFKCILNKDGDVMVDGGVANNFPIRMFDKRKYYTQGINDPNMETYVVNPRTIGFRLDTAEEIEANSNWGNAAVEINDITQYVGALATYLMEVANKRHLKDCDKDRTIFIETGNVKATDFDLQEEVVNILIANGIKAVNNYFVGENLTKLGEQLT